MKLNTLLVCDASLEKRQAIEALIYGQSNLALVGTVSGALAQEQIASLHPKLVWVELSPAPVRCLSLLSELKEAHPDIFFLASYEVPDPELVRTAYRLGASDFLDAERWSTDLPIAIQGILLKNQGGTNNKTPGKCIALFSPTGGTGVTTLATNLAGYLSKLGETCLIDLDLQFGMVSHYLNLTPTFNLGSIDAAHTSFDPGYLRNLMSKHSDNLNVLCAPPQLEELGSLQAPQMHEVLSTIAQDFVYSLIDLPRNLLDERSITALDLVDHILVITEYNWASIINARKCLDLFKAHYAQDKLLLVVNRVEWLPHDVLSECKSSLNYPIWAEVANDIKTARWSNNQGLFAPTHTHLGRSIDALAKRLVEVGQPDVVRSGNEKPAAFKLPAISLPAIFSRNK
jgi:pilus assembly protein CpaE